MLARTRGEAEYGTRCSRLTCTNSCVRALWHRSSHFWEQNGHLLIELSWWRIYHAKRRRRTNRRSGTSIPGPPNFTSQVETAFNSFCQALHANQLDTAFGDLTPGYQQSVGSSANLPNAVG